MFEIEYFFKNLLDKFGGRVWDHGLLIKHRAVNFGSSVYIRTWKWKQSIKWWLKLHRHGRSFVDNLFSGMAIRLFWCLITMFLRRWVSHISYLSLHYLALDPVRNLQCYENKYMIITNKSSNLNLIIIYSKMNLPSYISRPSWSMIRQNINKCILYRIEQSSM